MYAIKNFKSKKALKEAIQLGQKIGVWNPGLPFGGATEHGSGSITLEGPHYPAPHRWYAEAVIKDGVIVSVK